MGSCVGSSTQCGFSFFATFRRRRRSIKIAPKIKNMSIEIPPRTPPMIDAFEVVGFEAVDPFDRDISALLDAD